MIKNIIIVEDEALIADQLENMIMDFGFNCVGVVDTAADLFKLVDEVSAIDLILLDINLEAPIDGVDIAHTLNNKYQIPFVFITSNTDSRTLERIKLTQPAGFVIKPFTEVHVKTEIELALAKTAGSNPLKGSNDSFFIKSNQRLERVYFDDLIYVEANDNFCVLYTKHTKHIYGYPLKQAAENLAPHEQFIRVHRSYIVNLQHIIQLKGKMIMLSNQKEIPFSENLRNELYQRLNIF